jgi:D-3-phosphoglycerate dehydrogenase
MARLGLRDRQGRTRGLSLPEQRNGPPEQRKSRRAAGSSSFQDHFSGKTNSGPPSQKNAGVLSWGGNNMAPRVLISDSLSPAALAIFKERGVEVDFQPALGKDKDKLAEVIGDYDGLAIRSATKVTAKVLERAKRLKVVGRAGIGVDNVDIPAATARGVIVMNTPFGNSITTAEHAIAMMFALAREIPAADASTQAGKWEKNRFMGVEITGKVLGVIGCGNIGAIVAERALGLKMRVIAFDPFLSPERAKNLGVEKVELDDLLARADFITLHTPMTAQTKNILSADNLARTKKGVRVINCARGGLVDEVALRAALDSGHVAGAAFDVFIEEPAVANPLFGHPHVVCTPHLGASTNEAQENVALQVAEQMSDYLTRGAISNAVNFPSITAEEAPKLKPFIALAEKLGSFAGQQNEAGVRKLTIAYEGHVGALKTKALTAAALAGFLRPMLADVNVVSAPVVAKERGMVIEEILRAAESDYDSLITLAVETESGRFSLSGSVFNDGKPRIVEIAGIRAETEFASAMIYVSNEDKPGFIGRFATLLGEAGVNIATFALGRDAQGGSAVALVGIDGDAPAPVFARITALPGVKKAKVLKF